MTGVPPAPTLPPALDVAPATTTAEENLHTSGQRRVNIIWEGTQAAIALSVVAAVIYCAVVTIEAASLVNMAYLIVGFYFGRTNHERSGGVGGAWAGRR